jgi:hypothetical protein
MKWSFEHPIVTSSLGAGVVLAYGLITFMLGVNYAKLQANKTPIDVGSVISTILLSSATIGAFEYVIRKEGTSKAEEYLRAYHGKVHKLRDLVYKLSNERLRDEYIDTVNDLDRTLKESIAEVNAAKAISKWLRNKSHLEDLRNEGVEIAKKKFDIPEDKVLKLFANDIYDYLVLVRDTLPTFGPWVFDGRRLFLAYQEGILPDIEAYITSVNFLTQRLEAMFNFTGAAETLADEFLDYLRQIDAEKKMPSGSALQI